MKAKDAMTSPALGVVRQATLEEVARIMLERKIGSVLVLDEAGHLLGIVTESDFLKERGIPFSTFRAPMLLGRFLGKDGLEQVVAEAKKTAVGEIMSAPVHAVGPEEPLTRVLEIMLEYDVNHVPVVDPEGKPLGIITRFDLLRLLKPRL